MAGKLWSEIKDFRDRHMKEGDDTGEGAAENPFASLEIMSVLQEARAFNESNFVRMHPKRCCQVCNGVRSLTVACGCRAVCLGNARAPVAASQPHRSTASTTTPPYLALSHEGSERPHSFRH